MSEPTKNDSHKKKQKSASGRRVARLEMAASAIATLVALTGVTFSTYYFFDSRTDVKTVATTFVTVDELQEIEAKIKILDDDISSLTAAGTSVEPAQELVALTNEISLLGRRLELLEEGLLNSPEKALSVPLLRKDLESLKERFVAESLETTRSVDRMYDQNKWFIGLMFTMAIGLMGLAISNFIQARSGH
jgi:hypothetical protein